MDHEQIHRGNYNNYRVQGSEQNSKKLQLFLGGEYNTKRSEIKVDVPFYGDVTELNTQGDILHQVGKDTLEALCSGVLQILGSSLAIYEKNGDYAFGMFVSGWCQLMDTSSRKLCPTADNRKALAGKEWLCHVNCWYDSAKVAITTGTPTNIDCIGGIKLYAEPIFANGEVIGAINIGYGNPPTDEETLAELSQKFQIPVDTLSVHAKSYSPRPPLMIDIAKKRLHNIATAIGKIVENVQNKTRLVASEARYHNLFNYMSNGVAVYKAIDDGQDFIIKDLNGAAEKIDKLEKEKVIGQSALAVFPQIVEFGLFRVFQEVYQTGKPQHHPVSFYQDDRIAGWRENYVFKLPYGEIVSIFNDITEQKKAEELLKQSEIKYRQLVETINEGIMQIDKDGYINYVNCMITEMFGCDEIEIIGKHLFNFMKEKEIPYAKELMRRRSKGISERHKFIFRKKNKELLYTFLSTAPIFNDQGEYIGAIAGITDISSLKRAEDRLKDSFGGIINVLSNLSEARDLYTAGHQKRVSLLSVTIAQELKLSSKQVEGIRIAALIHDIGKIGMPIEILTKPGKLSELEFNLIKEHPQFGYSILKDINFPYPIAEIVWQHHEKLDGSGYPRHLKGSDIKIEAQILCVADVVEAMASYRPYRPALGIEAALEEILNNRGVLYNPEAVDACVRLFREKDFQFQ